MMFAVLGEVPFQVVGSPESLSASRRYHYAEHRVVQDRPRLQWIAPGLETIRLELLLHRSFTDPAANLIVLLAAAEMHQALPLVFGNGDFRGYFVITEISTLSRQLSAAGDPIAMTVRLVLRESPVELDPNAPALAGFVPIGIIMAAAAASSAAPAALASGGLSALLAIAAPPGPPAPNLKPADVPPAAIVRSV